MSPCYRDGSTPYGDWARDLALSSRPRLTSCYPQFPFLEPVLKESFPLENPNDLQLYAAFCSRWESNNGTHLIIYWELNNGACLVISEEANKWTCQVIYYCPLLLVTEIMSSWLQIGTLCGHFFANHARVQVYLYRCYYKTQMQPSLVTQSALVESNH